MAAMQYDVIDKYVIKAVLTQPLHVGSANSDKSEVLIDPVSNYPFVQASGLAGVFRSYYQKMYGISETNYLFGNNKITSAGSNDERDSRIKFFDGRFDNEQSINMELRAHVKIDPFSGTAQAVDQKNAAKKAGQKFNMEYIGAGSQITFSFVIMENSQNNSAINENIQNVLAAIDNQNIQIGGQKSNGSGYLKLNNIYFRSFNMRNANDRKNWIEDDCNNISEYTDIATELDNTNSMGDKAYIVTINGKTESELLVKSIFASDVGMNAADSENIKNANKEYIVPGSSLKGAIRHQMDIISKYIGIDNIGTVMNDTFGVAGDDGYEGNIIFKDSIVGNREDNDQNNIQTRIHVDKLTAGVIYGAKFTQKNICGDITITIGIKDKNNPEKSLGLLLLAIRDLAAKRFNLGSGYNIGKGFIDIDKIIVCTKDGNNAEIDVNSQDILDDSGIINNSLKALKEA